MKFLIVIVLSLLGIAGSTQNHTKEELTEIVAKFMVKLEIQKPTGCRVCSGSFIFKNWILTAGHCLINAGFLIVYPVLNNVNNVGYTINKRYFVTRTYMHGSERDDDIALIKFPYNESWDHISPVRLPNAVDPPSAYHGKEAIFSRFDSACTGKSSIIYILQYATILKETSCTLGTRFIFFDEPLREEHLCARTRHLNLCKGDTSGHLVLKDSNELVGFLSQPKHKPCPELIFNRINTQFIEFVTGIDLPGGGWNKKHNATMREKTK